MSSIAAMANANTWEQKLGQCLDDNSVKEQQQDWRNYQNTELAKVAINAPKLNNNLQVPKEEKDDIANLFHVAPLVKNLDQLARYPQMSRYLNSARNASVLNAQTLATELSDPAVQKLTTSNSKFNGLVQETQSLLKKSDVANAFQAEVNSGVSFASARTRAQADQLLHFYQLKGVNLSTLSRTTNMRNLPYPRIGANIFVSQIQKLSVEAVDQFLFHRPVSSTDIASLSPARRKLLEKSFGSVDPSSAQMAETINKVEEPKLSNVVDLMITPQFTYDNQGHTIIGNQIYSVSPAQMTAISVVARTFLAEAGSCEREGLSQFEAVGLVIANRVMAVRKAQEEQAIVDKTNAAALANSHGRRIQQMANPYRGMADFGRSDRPDLDIAAQVVSRSTPLRGRAPVQQFSAWNSYSIANYNVKGFAKRLSPNIPAVSLHVKGPRDRSDTADLMMAVCPTLDNVKVTSSESKVWQKAVELAKQVVLDPEQYQKTYAIEPANPNFLFYSHGVNVSGQQPFKFVDIVKKNPQTGKILEHLPLVPKSESNDSCSQLHLYQPMPDKLNYGLE